MPRPQPIILAPDHFRPGSPRYRYQPQPLRTSVKQFEKLVVHVGEDVITQLRHALDLAQLVSLDKHKSDLEKWARDVLADPALPQPAKPRFDFDLLNTVASLAQGVHSALTGALLVSLQTEYFLAAQVEVEITDVDAEGNPSEPRWGRLVKLGEGASSELDCEGFDYDLPPEDLLPLTWLLLEVNIIPLFRNAWAAASKLLGKPKATDSTKPSSEPAGTSSSDD